jgi:ABC-2 type transport system permease protein
VTAINQLWFVAFLFLSGYVAPLALLPPFAQTLATWLPFYRMLGFPVDVLLGHLPMQQVLIGLGAQVAWLIVAYAVLQFTWSRGIRQYSAVGA